MSLKKKHVKRTFEEAALQNINESVEEEPKEKVSKDLLVIAQEVKIVKTLACNDVNKRIRQVRKLRKWFRLRTRSSFPFNDEDFMRIWKGLYYTMWMSDKPLVQEELAEQLSQLVEHFDGNIKCSIDFFGAFLRTMCQEWFGIDQWRIDKFLMLVRRMIRYTLRVLKTINWDEEFVKEYNIQLEKSILAENPTARGLVMHYLDVFFEELAKVSDGKINATDVDKFLLPFIRFIANQRDVKLIGQCRTRVLFHLLYQSAIGREYSDKYNAWKEMGFPTASIHDLEKNDESTISEDSENGENGDTVENGNGSVSNNLDPRAGDVDVYVPELPFNADSVINEFNRLLKSQEFNSKRRKALRKLVHLFEVYKGGEFPLGVKRMPINKSAEPFNELITNKVHQLENLENNVYESGRKLKKLNKRKRRKLLSSINFENIDEDNYEDAISKLLSKSKGCPSTNKKLKKGKGHSIMTNWKEEAIDINGQAKEHIENDIVVNNDSTPSNDWDIKKMQLEAAEEWDKPLDDGEIEFYVPSRKIKISEANDSLATSNDEIDPLLITNDIDIDIETEQATKKANDTTKKSNDTTKKSNDTAKKATDATKKANDATKKTNDATKKTNDTTKKANDATKKANDATKKKSNATTNGSDNGKTKFVQKQCKVKLIKPVASVALNIVKPLVTLSAASSSFSPSTPKRVKIALNNNTCQKPSDYLQQLKNSPNLPYDANKKPGKGVLKPNLPPSPINPFYKKKIGFKRLNDSL